MSCLLATYAKSLFAPLFPKESAWLTNALDPGNAFPYKSSSPVHDVLASMLQAEWPNVADRMQLSEVHNKNIVRMIEKPDLNNKLNISLKPCQEISKANIESPINKPI